MCSQLAQSNLDLKLVLAQPLREAKRCSNLVLLILRSPFSLVKADTSHKSFTFGKILIYNDKDSDS